ncbi:MAG: hypothetical protein ACFCU6_03270 [Balneolaceae bacterium]
MDLQVFVQTVGVRQRLMLAVPVATRAVLLMDRLQGLVVYVMTHKTVV